MSLEVESRCLLCVKRDRLTVAVSRLQQNLTGFLALPGVKTRTGLLLMVSLFFGSTQRTCEESAPISLNTGVIGCFVVLILIVFIVIVLDFSVSDITINSFPVLFSLGSLRSISE